jgi:uncharacterized protein YwlG (UPF0340 family)
MGHKGDIENRYTTNKCKLPENVIEDMREAYKRSQEYLQTTKIEELNEEKLNKIFKRQALLLIGLTSQEVDKMDLSTISFKEIQEIMRKRLLATNINDCTKQKAVPINEVNKYLEQGWEYVATLPNRKVIIKRKT